MTQLIVSLITIFVVLNVFLLAVAYGIMLERKVASWIQNRIGPNRTNFSFGIFKFKHHHWGLGQALADGIKLVFKEDYNPPHVNKALFILAPVLAVIPAMLAWAIMPWGGYLDLGDGMVATVAAAPISVGLVYVLAMGSLGVYGVVVGGYASNNKYAFLGGLRATAQMLSYEIPMGIGIIIVLLMTGSADASIVAWQQAEGHWNILYQPLVAVIFFTCILAECNRAPFDLAEAEQELVGGFHTEYASLKWGLFFLGEYMHMLGGCAFFALLFLGGWDVPLPFVSLPPIGGIGLVLLKVAIFASKVAALYFIMMWIRWTLPRFRFDQLMQLAWRILIPISLVLMLLTGLLVYLQPEGASKTTWQWTMLGANVLVFVGAMVIGPMLPKGPPVNRRVKLEGSRFSAPETT